MKHSFFQRAFCIALLIFAALNSQAQEMTNDKIEEILEQAPFITMNSREGNVWDFTIEDRGLVIITDENANRMRILSAAAALEEVESKQLMDAMKAQFHKALDIKYAVFQDVVWSMYAHPLKELTDEMFLDAIQQVYYGAVNFGTSYKSTDIQFGMGDEE